MQVRLYATLRQITGTREVEIPVEGQQTVGAVLRALVERYPRLSESIWYPDGSLAGHVAVLLNGRDVRHLDGVDTSLSDDDSLAVFPPVGGGRSGDDLTRVTLRFTTDFRARVEQNEVEFAYKGNTLRALMKAMADQFDIADLLTAGEELRPSVQVVINGRPSYTIGGLQAEIPDGASVVLFACRGVLTPVPLPAGTTLSDLRDEGT